jgi:hypothetical protein
MIHVQLTSVVLLENFTVYQVSVVAMSISCFLSWAGDQSVLSKNIHSGFQMT